MSTQTTQPSSATEVGQPWLLVARREVATKLVDRSFLVGTLLTLALIIGFVGLQAVLAERTKTYDLVVTSSAQTMADAVARQAPTLDDGIRVTVVPAADDAAAEAAVRADDADAWLTERDGSWLLVAHDEVPSGLEAVTATARRWRP